MLSEHQRLTKQIKALEKQISELPEGKLVISHNKNHTKWYVSDGHNKIYIPKKQRPIAEKLAAKKYISLLLDDIKHEQTALEFYLKHHLTDTGQTEKELLKDSEFQHLLAAYLIPKSEKVQAWSTSPFEHNPKHPEQLIHKSGSGHFVRSKSEAIIDSFLHLNRIPFRYECILTLGDTTLYPDFTIRHPETDEIYYWEHFGLMDDPAYAKNTYSKLQLYSAHGIIPSVNLITTYETKSSPLSSEMVMQLINYYFL